MNKSEALFQRAQKVIPGGVNSPVRAFRAVGGTPPFIRRGAGARLWDEDGREYLDFVGSWGPMILGHSHPAVLAEVEAALRDGLSFGAPTQREVLAAEQICKMTGLEEVRMVNSGTEAVMSALRLARGATGRNRIVKFAGCYHGHSDSMLVKAGSGALTAGTPDSLGIPPGAAGDTLVAEYNSLPSVEELFAQYPEEIACVIVEPVAANMGVVPPEEGFLQGLRDLCSRYGALLIFDEVITGFRLTPGGAQEYYGIRADLVTYGKIIGGGMPVGAYGGSRALMEQVAPAGKVYQAGTLSGNPVAMAAGLAQLSLLEGALYEKLEALGAQLEAGLREIAARRSLPLTVNRVGSLVCVFFREGPVRNYRDAQESDTAVFAAYFRKMLARGMYIAPSQFEALFLSASHQPADVDRFLTSADEALSR